MERRPVMIIWGSGGNVVPLGRHETRHCETCEKERLFNLVLRYRYWHLYWIFALVTQKKYLLVCEICQRGWELPSRTVEEAIGRVPIPFMRRYGFVALVLVIAVCALLGR
jgi:hypothetical protein